MWNINTTCPIGIPRYYASSTHEKEKVTHISLFLEALRNRRRSSMYQRVAIVIDTTNNEKVQEKMTSGLENTIIKGFLNFCHHIFRSTFQCISPITVESSIEFPIILLLSSFVIWYLQRWLIWDLAVLVRGVCVILIFNLRMWIHIEMSVEI